MDPSNNVVHGIATKYMCDEYFRGSDVDIWRELGKTDAMRMTTVQAIHVRRTDSIQIDGRPVMLIDEMSFVCTDKSNEKQPKSTYLCLNP